MLLHSYTNILLMNALQLIIKMQSLYAFLMQKIIKNLLINWKYEIYGG